MALSAEKIMKFLDITNYLVAETSLVAFYKSYNVSTPKGSFPYEWFDSLSKLNDTGLPPQTCFRSMLTKKTIDHYDYMKCWNEWYVQGMKTFADYSKHYNNADVIGFVEAVDKMVTNEREDNSLDMFKESVSLPGLTQKYLFKRLDPQSEYFVGFGKEQKHLVK